MSDEQQTIRIRREDSVQWVTLSRPAALNALNEAMVIELLEFFGKAQNDDSVRCIVITGEGRAFCAGGDVKGMKGRTPSQEMEYAHRVASLVHTMTELGKPVIAAVNGVVAGGACQFVWASDFAIASENARFVLKFPGIGLVPDLGSSFFLPRMVGLRKAKEMLLVGADLDAQTAHGLGLINEVVPHGELEAAARAWVEKLIRQAPIALALAKRNLNRALQSPLQDALYSEALAQGICFSTQDLQEGLVAQSEKRLPQFRGR